ncbi:Threonine/homoserine/homoserine lactone efflux protein [Seinonella peptonophila]|uniref:Threonine/homoserine/homoserine lactone efflux protein n=1 Tax=Seinonella peptonophila TaxID=112248 RepID=A0A1M5B1W1_9BACL|nr:LysE family transporter [Seinonella peptonophila]SHF36494.1 Threonine/homoserine/homoserine lactone efflux protein [Seinonella peptonophila]
MPKLSFLLFIFVSSFTPGPNNIMSMMLANRYGLKRTLPFCFGVGTGFFVVMIGCIYFNLVLQSFVPKIESFMVIVGSAYMIYLAVKIIIGKTDDDENSNTKRIGFITGTLLQFINPKGILYGITVISTFIIPYHTSKISLLLFSIFIAFIGFISTFSWSLFGSVFNRFLSQYRVQFNILMALLLIYCSVSIIFEQR